MFGSSQVISQKAGLFELLNDVREQVLFIHSIFSGYDDIHISASRLAPSVGATDLNSVHIERGNQLTDYSFDVLKHLCYFLSRDLLLEFLVVLEAYLLIFRQQIRPFLQLLNRFYSHVVKLLSLARSYSPYLAELTKDNVLLRALQLFKLRYLSSLE